MQHDVASDSTFDRFARFYDDDYRDYDADLGAILDLAEHTGGPILEMGCGTGRVILPLTSAGYTVTGVDVSPALLEVARRKVAAAGLTPRVTLLCEDLRNARLPSATFKLAICTSNTLMHFTTADDQMQALAAAHAALQPGGLLFLDLFSPDVARLVDVQGVMELADRWHDLETGAEVLKWSVRSVDFAEQLQETLFIYEELTPSGETRRTACPFVLRFLWRHEGELMLRDAGFAVEEVWGDGDGNPYDSQSEHLIFVARRA